MGPIIGGLQCCVMLELQVEKVSTGAQENRLRRPAGAACSTVMPPRGADMQYGSGLSPSQAELQALLWACGTAITDADAAGGPFNVLLPQQSPTLIAVLPNTGLRHSQAQHERECDAPSQAAGAVTTL